VTYTWFNTTGQQVGYLWGDGTPSSSSTDCATDPGAPWTSLEVDGPVDSGMNGAAYLGIDFVVNGSGSTPSQGIALYWQVLTDPADAGGAEIVIQEL
jgi:hypothetical protein